MNMITMNLNELITYGNKNNELKKMKEEYDSKILKSRNALDKLYNIIFTILIISSCVLIFLAWYFKINIMHMAVSFVIINIIIGAIFHLMLDYVYSDKIKYTYIRIIYNEMMRKYKFIHNISEIEEKNILLEISKYAGLIK